MVYAGNQVAFETDSNNTTLSTIYTWGPGIDHLLGIKVGSTAYTVVTDPLGSVRALVRRSDGAWMGRLLYDPYGQLVDSAGPQPALRTRWTGREWDAETGFYFHRTRYYDPTVGRFVQEDQIGYAGSSNLYAYVNGDVLQARDADGLEKEWVDAGGFIPGCVGGSALLGDGSIVAGGCEGAGGRLAALGAWGARTAAIAEGILSIRSTVATFTGTPTQVAEMIRAWEDIARALELALREMGRHPETRFMLNIMTGGAGSRFSVTFVAGNAPGFGMTGANNTADETTITVDLDAIHAAAGYTTTATIMAHEFGHAYYNWWTGDAPDNWVVGNAQALGFENAYRRAVGYNLRPDHGPCHVPLWGGGACKFF